MQRRRFVTASLLLAAAACGRSDEDQAPEEGSISANQQEGTAGLVPEEAGTGIAMQVWKSPTCGCCSGWVDHVRAAGYALEVEDVSDIDALKRSKGIPSHLASCHTALVGGYLIEGHVPTNVIGRLLGERPEVMGIAVPGMPTGTPGMEVPGQQADRYDVIAFKANGESHVY